MLKTPKTISMIFQNGVQQNFLTERYEIERSEFFGCIKRTESKEDFDFFLKCVRASFKQADHYCYAYVIKGGETPGVHSNDGGEPGGTAGKPILECLMRENLQNVGLIVARYFGGKKLGAGGLARAYSKSAVLAVRKAENEGLLEEIIDYIQLKTETVYSDYENLIRKISEYSGRVIETVFSDKVRVDFEIPEENSKFFCNN